MSALDTQIGGNHYKTMPIQPMEFSMANGLDACQHTIVKYVTRFREKGGVLDLEKAKHVIDMLIEFEKAKHEKVSRDEDEALDKFAHRFVNEETERKETARSARDQDDLLRGVRRLFPNADVRILFAHEESGETD